MKRIFYLYLITFIRIYSSDYEEEKSIDSDAHVLAESIRISPHFSSKRLLTPGQRKRIAAQTYIIESTVEPSKKAVRSSPKMEELEKLRVKFDQRPLLAYNEKTGTFRMIKDESELQQEELLHPCSPRLTEENIREKYNIQD